MTNKLALLIGIMGGHNSFADVISRAVVGGRLGAIGFTAPAPHIRDYSPQPALEFSER